MFVLAPGGFQPPPGDSHQIESKRHGRGTCRWLFLDRRSRGLAAEVPLSSEMGTTCNVLSTVALEPRPESGRDCLICATFARQVYCRGACHGLVLDRWSRRRLDFDRCPLPRPLRTSLSTSHMNIYVYTYICIYMNRFMYIHTYMYAHICIHTYIYIYTHTHIFGKSMYMYIYGRCPAREIGILSAT